jgi:hypothetical protein
VLSGASVFQTRLLSIGSGLAQAEDANGSFTLSDVDGDGKSDLVFFKRRNTGGANVQVRVMSGASNYQTLIEAVETSITLADSANGDFEMANIDTDTKPDLVFIKRRNTATGTIEVHERSGSSGYQIKIKSVPSAITSGLSTAGDFVMQDFDLDSRPELVFVQRKLTSGSIVVKVLSGGQK